MLVVHDSKIETRRWEAIIESTCEGPREKRPKYKDLALQQPPKNLPSFFIITVCVCVQRSQVSPKALLIPLPLLPPSSKPFYYTTRSFLLQYSSYKQAGLALDQSIITAISSSYFETNERKDDTLLFDTLAWLPLTRTTPQIAQRFILILTDTITLI
jgi:hypothetical protein